MCRHAFCHDALELRLKVRRHEFRKQSPDVFAQNAFKRLTQFFDGGSIGVGEAPLTIHGDKHFRDTLEYVADALFGPLELLLPELVLRHVDHGSDILRDFPSIVAYWYGHGFQPAHLSIRRLNTVADGEPLAAGYRFGARTQHVVAIARMYRAQPTAI